MTVDKLESLSLEELYSLADRTGLDLPPGLARPFVVEEILGVLEDESEDRRISQGETLHVDEKKYSELLIDEIDVDLVADDSIIRRYNETMIRAIVRDPSWAFAFWDVSDVDLESLRGEEGSAGLFLRVVEMSGPAAPLPSGLPAEKLDPEGHREFFDIPIADNDLQWYINLPRSGVRFRIDLCARRASSCGKPRALARSNEVESPRQSLPLLPDSLDPAARELLALSGVEDLYADDLVEDDSRRLFHAGTAESADRAD